MAKFIMGIGIPGSGKTTFLRKFAVDNHCEYISSDDVRAEMTGSATDMTTMQDVWGEIRNRIVKSLQEGKDTVLDSTLYKEFDRKNIIDIAKMNGATEIEGVYMDVPLEIAKERNLERSVSVPERALDRMWSHLELEKPVNLKEGFDKIFVFDENAELKEVRGGNLDSELGSEIKFR